MKKHIPVEFIYQIFSLIVVIIIVHGIYVSVVRPNADAELKAEALAMQEDPTYVAQRSMYVIMRDYEQEACVHPLPLGHRDHGLQGDVQLSGPRPAAGGARARHGGHEDPAGRHPRIRAADPGPARRGPRLRCCLERC